MTSRVLLSTHDHIANITLNRADKFNALDLQAFEQLADMGEQLRQNPDIRVVIISGEGNNFRAAI